ncbi:hypothetical protein G5714_001777 [Onychostoma macrolepis]|uniref:Uncharacterized protein n=1 Tax=Onychostoma macrolepis TaxID=369639 RepID=A0A7J6DEG9_9TELE|nr:hypothetical protein G5714_001777 [Onychostoma macrolepis]
MTIAMKEELLGSFCKKETANGSLTISVRHRDTDIGDTVSPTRYDNGSAFFWFRHRKSVDIELSNKLKSQDKSHDEHSRESPYSGYAGGHQPTPQSPIYENFHSGQSNQHEFQRSVQSEDTHRDHQAYLQCDPHDAIYSNDPALFHPDQAEFSEDVYIMPDA